MTRRGGSCVPELRLVLTGESHCSNSHTQSWANRRGSWGQWRCSVLNLLGTIPSAIPLVSAFSSPVMCLHWRFPSPPFLFPHLRVSLGLSSAVLQIMSAFLLVPCLFSCLVELKHCFSLGMEEWEAFLFPFCGLLKDSPHRRRQSCVLEFQEVTIPESQKLDWCDLFCGMYSLIFWVFCIKLTFLCISLKLETFVSSF